MSGEHVNRTHKESINVTEAIQSASEANIFFRRIVNPNLVWVKVGSIKRMSLGDVFRKLGVEDKLAEIFERHINQEDEGPVEEFEGFIPGWQQRVADIFGKKIHVWSNLGSGTDPYTKDKLPEDTEISKMVKNLYRNHPYATGEWFPQKP